MPQSGARALLAFATLVLLIVGFGCSNKSTKHSTSTEVPATPAAEVPLVRPVILDAAGRPLSFSPLVHVADPAVTVVRALQRGAEGLGTGFVYDSDGYLLTNHHVIDNATDIIVNFRDGRELVARVVGADPRTDIAVLHVEATNLPALPLGDSDALEVGDWVVAIGNPFGLQHTVSAGILSARGRTRDDVRGLDEAGYFDFLQTDASINLGNSGGPLINVKGEVVGINSAIRQNANSIGFAIPVNMVKGCLPRLLKDGKVQRSALGVTVDDMSSEQAKRLARPNRKGAWVKVVQPGGPADRGGISVDDVILGFDKIVIEDPNALRWRASIAGVGQTVTIRVARGTREFEMKVTMGELPDELPR